MLLDLSQQRSYAWKVSALSVNYTNIVASPSGMLYVGGVAENVTFVSQFANNSLSSPVTVSIHSPMITIPSYFRDIFSGAIIWYTLTFTAIEYSTTINQLIILVDYTDVDQHEAVYVPLGDDGYISMFSFVVLYINFYCRRVRWMLPGFYVGWCYSLL